jgi:CYTH domain-containing protein
MHNNNRIFRIAATGGVCGGKTSLLPYLTDSLIEAGAIVAVNPELAAYYIHESNISPRSGLISGADFQDLIIKETLHTEGVRFDYLASVKTDPLKVQPKVLLCDRGIMDGDAYVPFQVFTRALSRHGLTRVKARDDRYDAVIHMITAAKGAEKFYTCANNPARSESIEEARVLDDRTQRAWNGHRHWRPIDNSTDFEGKIKRATEEVFKVIGLVPPGRYERKFRIKPIGPRRLPEASLTMKITQVYLRPASPDKEIRLRRTIIGKDVRYERSIKERHGGGLVVETKAMISDRQFFTELEYQDPARFPVEKTRYCFLYANRYMRVDRFQGRLRNLHMAEVEVMQPGESIELPVQLQKSVIRDVTHNPAYTNPALARLRSAPALPA